MQFKKKNADEKKKKKRPGQASGLKMDLVGL